MHMKYLNNTQLIGLGPWLQKAGIRYYLFDFFDSTDSQKVFQISISRMEIQSAPISLKSDDSYVKNGNCIPVGIVGSQGKRLAPDEKCE